VPTTEPRPAGTKPRYQKKAGRIIAAGISNDVSFEPVHDAINDTIDAAYKSKYKSSPYLQPMIGPRARSTTMKIVPIGASIQDR
jgi:hypothetical protein